MGYHDGMMDAAISAASLGFLGLATTPRSRPCSYGQAAFAAAVDDGLMPDEVLEILAGRRVVEAFPVRSGEAPAAYAARAVAEMMVAYLADSGFDRPVAGA